MTDAVRAAARDAAQAGPAAAHYRYLWLAESRPAERRAAFQILSAHVNSLSRQPLVSPPAIVLADGQAVAANQLAGEAQWAAAVLLRVDLEDYLFERFTWDGLSDQDPYFSVSVVEHWPGGNDRNGKYWPAGNYRSRATAPWLAETVEDAAAIKQLVELTQARAPLLRADNFLWQTAIQAERTVGYYGLLGIAKRDDYLRVVGLDLKASRQFSPEFLAVITNSGVAREPRRIARFPSLGGAVYATFDNKAALNEANPIRFLNGGFKHQAEEYFGTLPNGFWAVGLFAANGDRQESAPDFVGFDRHTESNDGRIHVGLSCFRCHAAAGLQDFKDSVKNLYGFPQVLQTPSAAKALEVKQRYFQAIAGRMKRDREVYAEALRAASGLTPEQYARTLSTYFARYDAPVTVEAAAAELGVTPAVLLAKLEAARAAAPGLDNTLGFFTVEQARREPVPRQQFNEVYGLAQLALRGLSAWPTK